VDRIRVEREEGQKACRLCVLNWISLTAIALFLELSFFVSKFLLECEIGLLTALFAFLATAFAATVEPQSLSASSVAKNESGGLSLTRAGI
jgi:uncharacterized membrane protein